jgi:hypoxanthine phosphoribosyltransferase
VFKAEQAWQMLQQAELVCEAQQVEQAFGRLADAISADLRDDFPLLLCVMNGAVYFCGRLLPLLRFPLTLDYVHASRYGEGLDGREIHWRAEPQNYVKGRVVLILDDILDEGVTLAAIRERVLALGAAQCRIAVLAEKDTGKPKPVQADYVGVRVPDRFVFGCGLDAHGLWRNLPAIYALKP